MSNTTISVILIKDGIVKDIAHFDYTEIKTAFDTFEFHVKKFVQPIMDTKCHIPQNEIDNFCQDVYKHSNGYPSVFWDDNNSIQTVLDI